MRIVLARAESVLRERGQDAAIAYLLQALPDDSHLKRIRQEAAPGLRIAIYHAIADLETRRRKCREEEPRERERLAAESEQAAQRQRAIAQVRLTALREEKDRLADDTRIRWLAGLAPSERDAIAAKDERAAAVALRAGGITSGRVQIRLACSARELNAWDKAGLLPHLFKRLIRMDFGSQVARFWLADDVEGSHPARRSIAPRAPAVLARPNARSLVTLSQRAEVRDLTPRHDYSETIPQMLTVSGDATFRGSLD